jgi:hypothetical protein
MDGVSRLPSILGTLWPRPRLTLRTGKRYFFFVFFAAFGFAAALDIGFFAFFFAVIGMRVELLR